MAYKLDKKHKNDCPGNHKGSGETGQKKAHRAVHGV